MLNTVYFLVLFFNVQSIDGYKSEPELVPPSYKSHHACKQAAAKEMRANERRPAGFLCMPVRSALIHR